MKIIEADCLEAMREMDEGSVDAVVTDPPYGLEFMGKEWDRLDEPQVVDPAGRWPTNLALVHPPSCTEEACEEGCPVAELDRQSGEVGANGGSGEFQQHAWMGGDTPQEIERSKGAASRFFPRFRYEAKASRAERNAGLDGFEERDDSRPYAAGEGMAGRTMVDGEWLNTDHAQRLPRKNGHPTVKPLDLMRWLVKLVCPPQTPEGKPGLVLDPFAGSGTTGCAAAMEGFDFVGIEREESYAEIARARIAFWSQFPGQDTDDVLASEARSQAIRSTGQGSLLSGSNEKERR